MHITRKKVKSNFKTFVSYIGLWGFGPHLLISVLYFENLLQSYALTGIVFSFMFISTTISEIPIGVFSDMIGRRKTMIFGSFFIFFSVVFYLLASYLPFNPLYALCIGSCCHGLGRSFFSGTDEAIVYETAKYVEDRDFKKYYARGRAVNNLTMGTSAVLSGIISYYLSYEACHFFALISYAILIFVTFRFFDVPAKYREDQSHDIWKHIKEAFSYFKKSGRLRLLSMLNIIDDSLDGTVYRFEMVYLKLFVPEYLLGIFRCGRQYISAIGYVFSSKIVNRLGATKSLLYACIYSSAVRFFPLVINNITTPFLLSLGGAGNGMHVVSMSEMLQEEFSDKQRATMKSLITIFVSFFESLIMVLMGYLSDLYSVRFALMFIVSFKILSILIAYILHKREKRRFSN